MDGVTLTGEVRAALLRKYRLLARWRRAKDLSVTGAGDGSDGAEPAAMRALAEEFPGALRELDLLGLRELERRAACLAAWTDVDARDADLGLLEPWLAWIAAYHTLMRLALALRSATPPDVTTPTPPADEAFLRDVRRPPAGRLSSAVLQALARHFQRPAEDIRAALFPPRRQAGSGTQGGAE